MDAVFHGSKATLETCVGIVKTKALSSDGFCQFTKQRRLVLRMIVVKRNHCPNIPGYPTSRRIVPARSYK